MKFRITYRRMIHKDICGPAYESRQVDNIIIEADNRWMAHVIFHAGNSGKVISTDVVI